MNLKIRDNNGVFHEVTYIKGDKGDKGDQGETGAQGPQGIQGLSIQSTTVNSNGHLIITYTDSTTFDCGVVKGADGAGNMSTTVYDTNANGVVDNAEKLNNHPDTYFATADSLSNKADKTYISTNYDGKYIKLFEMAKGDTNFYYGELYQTTNYGVLSSLEVMFESRNHKAIVLSKGDYDSNKAVVKIYDDTTNNKYYGYLQAGAYNAYAGVKVNAQKGCDVTNTVVATAPTGTLIYDSTSNSCTLDNRTTIITNINSAVKNGKYKLQAMDTNDYSNMPVTDVAGWLIDVTVNTTNYLVQYATCYACSTNTAVVGKTYKRTCVNGTWQSWACLATDTEPTKYNMTLGTDNEVQITNVNSASVPQYLKRDGFVSISGEIKKTDGSAFSTGTAITLSTLPAGFKARCTTPILAVVANTGTFAYMMVTSEGNIIFEIPSGVNCTQLRFNGVFYVGSN